jgi:membrane protease YdiL (CAAX protease family)
MELSHPRGQQTTPLNSLLQHMQRHPLVFFYLMAFALTWLLWLPAVLLHLPVHDLRNIPGTALGVTGSAFLMTALTEGKAGVLRLLRSFVLWRVGVPWYVFAILGIPIIEVLVGWLLPGGQDALRAFAPTSLLLYPAAYAFRFPFGPFWEEAGWRGFALPRLQQHLGPLVGTLILGILWGIWHLPLYLPAEIQQGGIVGGVLSFAVFVLLAIAMAVIFTWVFNNTKGRLLIAILLHASIDGTQTYLQTLADRHLLSTIANVDIQQLGFTLGIVVLALLLIVFTRGHLSYERNLRETTSSAPEARVEQGSVTSHHHA